MNSRAVRTVHCEAADLTRWANWDANAGNSKGVYTVVARNDELYKLLQEFDIDGGEVALTFGARLARENSWSVPFAERVVAEYKRFVYLAMTAEHMVTPSVAVDEAWHLHLTYTKSYWERMCSEVLGRPLHHNPAEGGKSEQNKFLDLYNRTLETYRVTFGEEPPADIWPVADIRFAAKEQPMKVVPGDFWMIPKWVISGRFKHVSVLTSSAMFLSGCAWLLDDPATDSTNLWVFFAALFILVGIVLIVVILGGIGRGGRGGGGGGFGGFGCGGGGGCGGCGGG